jgi:hypothetical protein
MKPVDHVLAQDDQVFEQILYAFRAAVADHVIERDPPGLAILGDVLDLNARYLSHGPPVPELWARVYVTLQTFVSYVSYLP